YATFPWAGLAIASVVGAASKDSERSRRQVARVVLFGATVLAFGLVSWMRTKFHHYVLLALPSLAMLIGIWVDETLGRKAQRQWRASTTALVFLAAALIVGLVGLDLVSATAHGPARFILLLTYRYTRGWPSTRGYAAIFMVFAILGMIALAWAAAPR